MHLYIIICNKYNVYIHNVYAYIYMYINAYSRVYLLIFVKWYHTKYIPYSFHLFTNNKSQTVLWVSTNRSSPSFLVI